MYSKETGLLFKRVNIDERGETSLLVNTHRWCDPSIYSKEALMYFHILPSRVNAPHP